MDLKDIIVDKKELGKLVGAAKRTWTGTKKQVIKTDEISRAENAIFANDLELAQMVKAKQLLDEKISTHIDAALTENRGYNQSEINEKKEAALLELLKDALREFTNLTEAEDNYFDLQYPDMIERLGNMIKDMEEGMI